MAKRDEIKKVADISNEGTKYNNLKTTAKVANITERFDDTTHNDNPYDDAIQYLAKKVEDVIEESNLQGTASGSYAGDIKILKTASGSFSTRATTNDAKVSMVIGTGSSQAKAGNTTTISSGQASAITANTAKVGTETNLCITDGLILKATVAVNRNVHTLVFTMTTEDGKTTKTAEITLRG